ncbi:MAG TPA: DUF2071 domain-containing protein [Thermomicrobiales bacterium]|nr:DUF2071 domain-containing protein [Thermomicrobiales bacterium]
MRETRGRTWPTPTMPWVMEQVWNDLLFMHWPVAPEVMRKLVPEALPLDTYDGQAWIGVVPFWMSGVRARLVPPLPGLSRFPELNVRTYVTIDDKPGVYFFSLDASNRPAVAAARWYGLSYFQARMSVAWKDGWVEYSSQRTHRGAPRASLRMRYRPIGPVMDNVSPGTLDWWLTERYCLYVVGRDGQPRQLEIDHPRWPLQPAEAEIDANSMTVPLGLALSDAEPLLHFSRRQQMVAWPKVRV